MTRRKIYGVFAAVLTCILFCIHGECMGQDQALEQLIKVFEQKGMLNASEAQLVRETLAKEQEKTLGKEKEIEEKERALAKREKELKEKEEALQNGTITVSEKDKLTAEGATSGVGGKVEISDEGGPRLVVQEPYEFSLSLGGLLQVDYRYFNYGEEDPNKNKFDIRRARLSLEGQALKYFDYRFMYEFQGASVRNLLDAYADANVSRLASFRIGQFKEPYSLEQSTSVRNWVFTEASFVYYLSPQYDVGLMAHASLWEDRVTYGIGVFNGDGLDDTAGGNEDAPQVVGRVVFSPFKTAGVPILRNLQFGGSLSYANIDRNNVNIDVKTPGLITFFNVASNTKFRVIRDAGSSTRYDAELGWAYESLALMGEYSHVTFSDVTTSAEQFDIKAKAYYLSLLWMITGEKPSFRHGVFQPIEPAQSLFQGGWGALGVAIRYEAFNTVEDVYEYLINPGDSVRKANAYSIAVNWFLNHYSRLILDFSSTHFDIPLLIFRDPINGTEIFSDHENVFTGRFQFQF
jgi:phosphate-selective porin OprO and OprP